MKPVRRVPARTAGLAAKRVFDVTGAGAGLLAGLPVLIVAAIAVRVDSPGPVLFRQERVGRYGTRFRIHKFRTMRADSAGPLVSTASDGRVTRVGALLRRTKLDELPQLVDVLTGRMSIVGPRPEVPCYVELWGTEARSVILSVRPGITDPASLEFRYEGEQLANVGDPEIYYVQTLLPRKVALSLEYVETRTFVADVSLVLKTVWLLVAPAVSAVEPAAPSVP